jgi:hypothetical protein
LFKGLIIDSKKALLQTIPMLIIDQSKDKRSNSKIPPVYSLSPCHLPT